MKRLALIAFGTLLLASGCRKIEVDDNGSPSGGNNTGDDLILSGKINADRTLVSGKTYKLRGTVYVVDGAKLTIQSGVTIQGEKSSRGHCCHYRPHRHIIPNPPHYLHHLQFHLHRLHH